MKRSLFLFVLLLACPAFAQQPNQTFRGQELKLPPVHTAYRWVNNNFLITNDSIYKTFFPDSIHARLPVIDFNTHELALLPFCRQCEEVCGERKNCHRNACSYEARWLLRDKRGRQALQSEPLDLGGCKVNAGKVPSIITSDSVFAQLREQCQPVPKLTVDFARRTFLTRSFRSDCRAYYKNEFFLDPVNKVLVWRTFHTYGGCRASGGKQFLFTVPNPPEGYGIVFEYFDTELD